MCNLGECKADEEAPVTLQLTGQQRRLLRELLDMNIEGMIDGQNHTIADHSLQKWEELLDLSAGFDESKGLLEDIQRQLS
jgi:hypothetical protein